MIVLDASAAVELLLNTALGRAVARRLGETDDALHAPHLLDLEVAQVMRRFAASGAMTDEHASMRLRLLHDIDIERHAHEPLLDRIWALRLNLTAYDAAYIALAEALDAPLLTCDRKLGEAPGLAARIEVVS